MNLRRLAAEPKTLADALREATGQFLLDGATALLSTPQRFVIATLRGDGTLVDSTGAHVACEPAFEARVFCESAELRWLKTPEGGRAVIVTEEMTTDLAEWRKLETLSAEPLDQVYVVWGTGTGPQSGLPTGWSRLAEARIGVLDVPLADVPPDGHVELDAREYLVEEREHGNMVVAEERLRRLRPRTGGR
jgi:CRISPR-associated protein (TIGR03984 family)